LCSVLLVSQQSNDGFHITEVGMCELAVMLALAGLGLLGGGWLVRQQQ